MEGESFARAEDTERWRKFKKMVFKGEGRRGGEKRDGEGERDRGEKLAPATYRWGMRSRGAGKPRDEPAGKLAQEWHIL